MCPELTPLCPGGETQGRAKQPESGGAEPSEIGSLCDVSPLPSWIKPLWSISAAVLADEIFILRDQRISGGSG